MYVKTISPLFFQLLFLAKKSVSFTGYLEYFEPKKKNSDFFTVKYKTTILLETLFITILKEKKKLEKQDKLLVSRNTKMRKNNFYIIYYLNIIFIVNKNFRESSTQLVLPGESIQVSSKYTISQDWVKQLIWN